MFKKAITLVLFLLILMSAQPVFADVPPIPVIDYDTYYTLLFYALLIILVIVGAILLIIKVRKNIKAKKGEEK